MAYAELDGIKLPCGHLALPRVKDDAAMPGAAKKYLQTSRLLV